MWMWEVPSPSSLMYECNKWNLAGRNFRWIYDGICDGGQVACNEYVPHGTAQAKLVWKMGMHAYYRMVLWVDGLVGVAQDENFQ